MGVRINGTYAWHMAVVRARVGCLKRHFFFDVCAGLPATRLKFVWSEMNLTENALFTCSHGEHQRVMKVV